MTMTAHLQAPQATPVSTQKVDLLIVGAGASGCLLAAKLATAGKKVVILEAGPDIGTKDMVSSQIWSRRWRWNGAPTEGGGAVGAAFNSGWGGGGSASHHYAVWLRLHEEDFQVKSRFGVGNDWPLAYGDLRPFYDRIQEEVGISGDAKAEVWGDAAGFAAASNKLQVEASRFQQLAAAGVVPGMKAQARAVGGSCKGCHDKYRVPEKK